MQAQITLGSLFDGIGGFPLAGMMAGIRPVWASEIEPFPICVTTKRLPHMRHLGDIHAIHGDQIVPVDIVTFGSPCQNLSVAGKRSGLSGKQSSLFFEAVRIISEMREATNGKYPRWAVWENVPGALSSSKGQDFRQVLESLIRIKAPEAAIPMPHNKWLPAGEILGNDYSLVWRILDASKGWGVAQRRRRVFIVVDLNGASAGKVLFESEGMSRYTPPSFKTREGTAGCTKTCAGASGIHKHNASMTIEFNPTDSRIRLKEDGVCQTLTNRMGTGGNQVPLTLHIPMAYGIGSDQSKGMLSYNPHAGIYEMDTSRTLDCSGGNPTCNQGGIAIVETIAFAQNQRDEVRDLRDLSGALAASPGLKQQTYVAAFMGGQGAMAGGLGYREEQSPTLKATPSGGNTVPDVVYARRGDVIGRKHENSLQGAGANVAAPIYSVHPFVNTEEKDVWTPSLMERDVKGAPLVGQPFFCMTVGCYGRVAKEKTPTLEARGYKDPPVIGKPPNADVGYTVRRLTPGECCRLQGYPDGWTDNLGTEQPTDSELHWWADVFEAWYRAQEKQSKPPSKTRLEKWIKNPRTDAAEYKAYGNSVAVPCVFFVLAGIVWATETEG